MYVFERVGNTINETMITNILKSSLGKSFLFIFDFCDFC